VAARNTTSSRFVRLFLVSLIIILFYLPYTIFLLVAMSARIEGSYSWRKVHNPETFNAVMREPAFGQISFEKWVQIATGYIIFLFLGTGVDANAHYRRLLVYVGADKIWPSLRDGSGNRSRTPNDFSTPRGWTANLSSKAKKMLWSSKSATMNTDSTNDTWTASTCTNSVALDSIPRLHNVTTQDTLISQKNVKDTAIPSPNSPLPSFFSRYFSRPSLHGPLLPLFSYRNITEIASTKSSTSTHPTSPATTDTNDLSTSSITPIGVHARAWATDISSASPTAAKTNDGQAYGNNVHVVREVHQQREHRSEKGYELERVDKEMRDWA
jgi:pheromone a factor receptor